MWTWKFNRWITAADIMVSYIFVYLVINSPIFKYSGCTLCWEYEYMEYVTSVGSAFSHAYVSITFKMASPQCHGVWNQHKFVSLFNSLLRITTKEIDMKTPHNKSSISEGTFFSKYDYCVMKCTSFPRYRSFTAKRSVTREACAFHDAIIIFCIDGSVQDCSISIANALEIPQSCTKPSM